MREGVGYNQRRSREGKDGHTENVDICALLALSPTSMAPGKACAVEDCGWSSKLKNLTPEVSLVSLDAFSRKTKQNLSLHIFKNLEDYYWQLKAVALLLLSCLTITVLSF
jgi:hypothetical protein